MKIAYQKYPLVGNYTHPWVLLTIIIKETQNLRKHKIYFYITYNNQ